MKKHQEHHFIAKSTDPVIFEEVEENEFALPPIFHDRVALDVIHDGAYLPPEFLQDAEGNLYDQEDIQKHFVIERDWGANFVAARLAYKLGLPGFLTVNTARVIMDFGRFPGSTRQEATHLGRLAINHPFSELLDFNQKRNVLEDHYDAISDTMEEYLQGKLLKIAIHTYDRYNTSGTERPMISLVTRMLNYQTESRMPADMFDPLFPDVLADYTVDRVLVSRISLALEKTRISVGHNYPYLLPEGSIEVRHQVWRFFDWLHRRFVLAFPETAEDLGFNAIWRMLKDTNFRSAESAALRSAVHHYRRPTKKTEGFYEKALKAYHRIRIFLHDPQNDLIMKYRLDSMRCMSLGIEVRKDIAWDFDEQGQPTQPNFERLNNITDLLADSIIKYFNVDRMDMNKVPKKTNQFEGIENINNSLFN